MIDGLNPLFVFTFPVQVPNPFEGNDGLKTIGEKTQTFLSSVGVPIPIYLASFVDSALSEFTGINPSPFMIISEGRGLELQTTVDGTSLVGTDVSQRGIDNVVTVNISARRDSLLLSAFLALFDLCYDKAVGDGYTLSYFNGPTTVIGGKLRNISTNVNADNDKIEISIEISKSKKSSIVSAILDKSPTAIALG